MRDHTEVLEQAAEAMLKPGFDLREAWMAIRLALGFSEEENRKALEEAASAGVARSWVLLAVGQIPAGPDDVVKMCARCSEYVPLRALFGRGAWWVCKHCLDKT